jgi:hypothetical protein
MQHGQNLVEMGVEETCLGGGIEMAESGRSWQFGPANAQRRSLAGSSKWAAIL